MGTAATIAVLGDLGPFQAELLRHREIELLIAGTFDELSRHLSGDLVDVCVVGPAYAGEVEPLLPEDLPVVTLAASAEQAALIPHGAGQRRVHTMDSVDSLVRLLEQHTGIKMAKEPRIDLRVAAAITIEGSRFLRETTDLSKSGVGIGRFPEAIVGRMVELVIDLPNGPRWLKAEVVRRYNRQGEPITGLVFRDLEEDAAEAIAEVVEGRLEGTASLRPMPAEDLEQLRAILSSSSTIEAPRWLLDLASELTPLEITAVRGGDAPEWAEKGLPLWLTAARCRFEHRGSAAKATHP